MSYAVKAVSTERGLDAAAFSLIAYGGAGPLHASAIAREIGQQRVIIPRAPGHFCAFGMLFSDLRYDFVKTWFTRLDDAPFAEIEKIYQGMIDEGRKAVLRATWKSKGYIQLDGIQQVRGLGGGRRKTGGAYSARLGAMLERLEDYGVGFQFVRRRSLRG